MLEFDTEETAATGDYLITLGTEGGLDVIHPLRELLPELLGEPVEVVYDGLTELQGDGVDGIVGPPVVDVMDVLLAADDRPQPQGGDGEHLGERPEHGDIIVLLSQGDGCWAVGEVVVGLVDEHKRTELRGFLDDSHDVLGRVGVPDRHIRVDEHDHAGIIIDRIEDLVCIEGEIWLIVDGDGVHAVEVGIRVIHVEGRVDDDEVLPGLSEDMEHVAHGDDAAVGDGHALGRNSDESGVFPHEDTLLGIHGEGGGRDVLHDLVEKPLGDAVRILVLIQPDVGPPALGLVLADGLFDVLVDVHQSYHL